MLLNISVFWITKKLTKCYKKQNAPAKFQNSAGIPAKLRIPAEFHPQNFTPWGKREKRIEMEKFFENDPDNPGSLGK